MDQGGNLDEQTQRVQNEMSNSNTNNTTSEDANTNVQDTTENIVKGVIDGITNKVATRVDVDGVNDKGDTGEDNNIPTNASQIATTVNSTTNPESVTVAVAAATDEKEKNVPTIPESHEEAPEQSLAAADNNDISESETKKSTDEMAAENSAEDMEVDEINTRANNNPEVQESDNSLANNNETDNNALGTKPERRTSKRQRAPSASRYSPGGDDMVASKKPKLDDGSSGPPTEPATANKDDVVMTQATDGEGDDAKTLVDEKASREGGNVDSVQEWSEPTYKWIDEGVKSGGDTPAVEHEGVEIDFTNTKTTDNWTPPPPFIVRRGDVVLISSGDTPWSDAMGEQTSSPNKTKREVIPIYNDPASRGAGLGALDPFIGVVERLWEERDDSPKKGSGGQKKKPKGGTKTSSSKMMMRTRWFFKKEELEGIKGSFIVEGETNSGSAKDKVLASLSSQDLVLTDQSDVNIVSTIMGKATVVKRKPLSQSEEDDEMTDDPKGTFVCRYNLSLSVANTSGKEAVVKLLPCTDGDDSGGFKDVDSSADPTSTDDDGYTSPTGMNDNHGGRNNNNYAAAPFSPAAFPMSPRRVVSEGGTTVGKIKVGPNHQADIPPQLDLQRKTSFRGLANPPSQRMPTMVWDPAADEGAHVDDFLLEACSILMNHLKEIGLEPFHEVNCIGCPDRDAEAKKPREAKIDCLLMELHECRGDTSKAIKKISTSPEKYMVLWDKKEKEQFDTSYRVYREAIHMIAKSMGDSKSCKDTVDYQYRFKYGENFRRFLRKKHDTAEEMMKTAEDRVLNEKLKADAKSQGAVETEVSSSETEEEGKVSSMSYGNGATDNKLTAVPTTHTGAVNNRIRTWVRTGGGDNDAVGATQKRRNKACGFLNQVREKVGDEAYATLANSIKACLTTDSDLVNVQATAKDIMKSHPELFQEFMAFIPSKAALQSN